jgi:glycosyltransferase involved in cell wall biosynthesis
MVPSDILFCALNVSETPGGIQRFNQRVISVLSRRAHADNKLKPRVHALKDSPNASIDLNLSFRGFGGRRMRFVFESSIYAIRHASLLIIDHINLLPLAMLVRLLRPRVRIMLFVHGIEVWDAPEFRQKKWYEPWILRCSIDQIVAVSRYTADIMAEKFNVPRDQFFILPNAVDPLPIAANCDRTGPPIVLTVTRLGAGERAKNVDTIIRALAVLVAADCSVPICLEIVGDGPLRTELTALAAALGVADRIRFLGRVSDTELNEAYKRAHVFALPSTKEGFGIVYLEAWQRGLPVVAATEGAAPEVVQSGIDGFTVGGRDVAALSLALDTLLTDRKLAQRFAIAGMRKVEERYLHRHFAEDFGRLLDEMACAT